MPQISTNRPIEYTFPNGQQAWVVQATEGLSIENALTMLNLVGPLPTLVVIGGASKMTPSSLKQLFTIFQEVVAPIAQQFQLSVFDGGTDAGVIQMMGQARQLTHGAFRLVGVAPRSKVKLPTETDSATDDPRKELEPHHTDFCLVPGASWGSESPWLAKMAASLARPRPMVTLLINGGQIALVDLQANLETGSPAIVLSGSGRLADAIADVIHGRPPDLDAKAAAAVAKLVETYYPHKLSLFDLSSPLEQLSDRLSHLFSAHDH